MQSFMRREPLWKNVQLRKRAGCTCLDDDDNMREIQGEEEETRARWYKFLFQQDECPFVPLVSNGKKSKVSIRTLPKINLTGGVGPSESERGWWAEYDGLCLGWPNEGSSPRALFHGRGHVEDVSPWPATDVQWVESKPLNSKRTINLVPPLRAPKAKEGDQSCGAPIPDDPGRTCRNSVSGEDGNCSALCRVRKMDLAEQPAGQPASGAGPSGAGPS